MFCLLFPPCLLLLPHTQRSVLMSFVSVCSKCSFFVVFFAAVVNSLAPNWVYRYPFLIVRSVLCSFLFSPFGLRCLRLDSFSCFHRPVEISVSRSIFFGYVSLSVCLSVCPSVRYCVVSVMFSYPVLYSCRYKKRSIDSIIVCTVLCRQSSSSLFVLFAMD